MVEITADHDAGELEAVGDVLEEVKGALVVYEVESAGRDVVGFLDADFVEEVFDCCYAGCAGCVADLHFADFFSELFEETEVECECYVVAAFDGCLILLDEDFEGLLLQDLFLDNAAVT